MRSRIRKSPRARVAALAVGLGVLGSLATAGPSMAVTLPAGLPLAGGNCQAGTTTSNEGKINGRGSTLQVWLQFAFAADFTGDVCGSVPADSAANSYVPPTSANCPGNPATVTEPTGDPTDPTSPIDQCTPNPIAPAYNADGMIAYQYPAAQDTSGTGSTQGKVAISCRTDAFSGTDIPYANSDLVAMDGSQGAESTLTGKSCIQGGEGTTFIAPFQTPNGAGLGSDAAGHVMSFPIGVSAVALAVNLPSTCYNTVGAGLNLSTADVSGLFGGTITNWSQITDTTNLNATACNVAVVRVVRNDTSGTTQGFLNYLNDSNPDTTQTQQTCSPSETQAGGTKTVNTDTFLHLALNANGDQTFPFGGGTGSVAYGAENNTWPGQQNSNPGGTKAEPNCSYVINSGHSGAPTLLHLLTTTSGGIGYADVSDVIHDPGDAAALVIPSVQSATGAQGTSDQLPYLDPTGLVGAVSGAQSNCLFGGSTPSLPASPVGLTGAPNSGDWSLDASSTTATNPNDDVTYATQGSSYPICSLTWDFVFAGEDGNNKTTVSGTQSLPTSGATLTLASIPAGTATSGTAEIKSPNELVTYSGIVGNVLQNVQGGFGKVLSGQTIFLPNGAGNTNPEPELTPDQRRTLYGYFSYVLSDPAQSTEASAGYAQLPETWLNSLRSAFQANF